MKQTKTVKLAVGLILLIIFIALVTSACIKNPLSPKKESPGQDKKSSADLSFDQEEATSDKFNDPNGPFYHKVYKAVSNDGLNFKKVGGVVLNKASVPDVVKMPDGRLIIYAVDGAARSRSGIMVAISKDSGQTFKQGSLQMESKEVFGGAADPQAVLLPNKTIRLFYVIFPAKKPPLDETGKPIPTGDKIKIKSALSEDGVNFVEEPGSRYETTSIVTDPDVIKISNKWFMYLADGRKQIATSSTDGDSFKLEKVVREEGSVSKTVPIGDGKYRQFFCEKGISSAVTTDGLNFKDEGSNLEGGPGQIICDPTPVKIGKQWILFYKAAKPPKGPLPGQPPQPPN